MKVGQLMTATEIRCTQKYWHVLQNVPSERIYNEIYDVNVVGIIWTSMVQFGTWFGSAPFLPYGIQLLPLRPISEQRDDLRWVNEMYYLFSKAFSQKN
jgi:endo-1,3(4)-beta-glucanase